MRAHPLDPAGHLKAQRGLGRFDRPGGGERAARVAIPERGEVQADPDHDDSHDDGCEALPIHGVASTVRASQSRDSSPVMRASSTRAEISACRASIKLARADRSFASASR